MKRDELNDLAAFVVVADEMSFTRAASKLGMSPSALSHAMKALEDRLGLRLLARTTRRVSTTEAGERLLKILRPAFEDISAELTALSELRDKPAGTVRITTFKHAATSVLSPVLPGFLDAYPDIRVEITIDDGLTDIVANRYDAGIRFGEKVAKDMIAVRVGPDIRAAVVGSPIYFANHPVPNTPQDLAGHRCINYRFVTAGGLYSWEFEEDGQPFQVRVDGPLVFNDGDLILAAALAGQGIGYLYEDQIADHVAEGRLIQVLAEWCPTSPGYYLYHPNRRQTPPALAALIDALRVKWAYGQTAQTRM
ncbi:LysR family transcriptional regulator [uncultured Nostoc sp.]|uniref:LysR family transcriptional regulator n=1 Tax=uncultured Nostoc sp. TaxID=340711 RepID=UPI0035CA7672